MLILLSPSKKLDEKSNIPTQKYTTPVFITDAEVLASGLKKLSAAGISDLMGLSDNLSKLNHKRFQEFTLPFTPENSRQALYTFKGDVYDKMDVENYTEDDLEFAQKHVRILSGLYGMLRPLDLMQPYRLEMGTKYKNERGENLYGFWDSRLTDTLNENKDDVVINLASNEYFSAIQKRKLKKKLITIVFKQYKSGKLKTIGLMAKRARGLMADYAIKNKITNPKDLLNFKENGYAFAPDLSKDNEWVFTMKMD